MRALHLPIADPCHEDWDAMDPSAQGRFCQKCTKPVHDLSSMSEPEARSLLRARAGGRICVRYEHDVDGRIRFRAPALAGVALAAVALAACTPHEHPSTHVDPTQSVEVPVDTARPVAITPVEQPITKMGEAPIIEPPPEVRVSKGDVAVPNEPCDPPPVVREPERPTHVRMGKPILRHDVEL